MNYTVSHWPIHPHTVLVIIPAYNEADSIGGVISRVRASAPEVDILVIDDGSTDATAAIAQEAGALVVSLPHNLGIGGAVQTGYIFAAEMGYDIAVQVDGDGQHDPAEIAEIVAPLLAGQADVVIGSRYIEDRGYITPFLRRMGIFVLASIVSLIIRQRVTDTTSGFRAVNRRVIEFCAREYPRDYPEPESVVLFRRAGFRVREIPVTMNPRYGGKSSITPMRSFYYMVKVLLAILIGLLRRVP
ncbi:MAG TPA: glycosyltransferase family 2 protein [Anaerolineae bacterium]|nr:glycosyltransferase family 2 protein [Anaerolineae bacterium]